MPQTATAGAPALGLRQPETVKKLRGHARLTMHGRKFCRRRRLPRRHAGQPKHHNQRSRCWHSGGAASASETCVVARMWRAGGNAKNEAVERAARAQSLIEARALSEPGPRARNKEPRLWRRLREWWSMPNPGSRKSRVSACLEATGTSGPGGYGGNSRVRDQSSAQCDR
jgi:hypothetical protein